MVAEREWTLISISGSSVVARKCHRRVAKLHYSNAKAYSGEVSKIPATRAMFAMALDARSVRVDIITAAKTDLAILTFQPAPTISIAASLGVRTVPRIICWRISNSAIARSTDGRNST